MPVDDRREHGKGEIVVAGHVDQCRRVAIFEPDHRQLYAPRPELFAQLKTIQIKVERAALHDREDCDASQERNRRDSLAGERSEIEHPPQGDARHRRRRVASRGSQQLARRAVELSGMALRFELHANFAFPGRAAMPGLHRGDKAVAQLRVLSFDE